MDEINVQEIEQEVDRSEWVDHPDNPAKYWDAGLEFPIPEYMKGFGRNSPDDTKPPIVAPTSGYTLTYDPPVITKPIGLVSDLKREFGKSGKLSDYYLTTTDIPSGGTIKLSDFDGISGTVRIVGDIRADRWADFTTGQLYAYGNRTWDGNDSTGIPADRRNQPAPNWENSFNNNWWLVYELFNDTSRVLSITRFVWRLRNYYYTQGTLANSTVINKFPIGPKEDDGTKFEDLCTMAFSAAGPTSPPNDVHARYHTHYDISPINGSVMIDSRWKGANNAERVENMKKCIAGGILFRHNMPTLMWGGVNYTSMMTDFKSEVDIKISLKSGSTLAKLVEDNIKDRKDELLVGIGVDTGELNK